MEFSDNLAIFGAVDFMSYFESKGSAESKSDANHQMLSVLRKLTKSVMASFSTGKKLTKSDFKQI